MVFPSQTGYDQPPAVLLFVLYASLRLLIDLALAPLRDRAADQLSCWCCATRSGSRTPCAGCPLAAGRSSGPGCPGAPAARALPPRFPDGVALVSLASLPDADSRPGRLLVVAEARPFLAPVPVEELPLEAEQLERLDLLGLRNLGRVRNRVSPPGKPAWKGWPGGRAPCPQPRAAEPMAAPKVVAERDASWRRSNGRLSSTRPSAIATTA